MAYLLGSISASKSDLHLVRSCFLQRNCVPCRKIRAERGDWTKWQTFRIQVVEANEDEMRGACLVKAVFSAKIYYSISNNARSDSIELTTLYSSYRYNSVEIRGSARIQANIH